jgi:hypothetical protein
MYIHRVVVGQIYPHLPINTQPDGTPALSNEILSDHNNHSTDNTLVP